MQFKSVSGGGTKIEEFSLFHVNKNDYTKNYFRIKMIKTESITHFYVKAKANSSLEPYKNQDFIVCDNLYRFRGVPWNEGIFNCFFYSNIGPNGFEISYYKRSNLQLDESFFEGDWVYLGGVPTNEIHKG